MLPKVTWSWALMSPGETTPSGHTTAVAPAAMALQSQPTQAMRPSAATRTCPPRKTSPGVSTSAVISTASPPAVTSQAASASEGRASPGQVVMVGGVKRSEGTPPSPPSIPPSGIIPSGIIPSGMSPSMPASMPPSDPSSSPQATAKVERRRKKVSVVRTPESKPMNRFTLLRSAEGLRGLPACRAAS